ncbi:jg19918 [Pararge aegeria aegeria]|uniref:Jg19918 protein n=1 Tax=Pararge aegeria aegeria TaxID=348720 RepID=A0A8S4S6R6_9NEOP|nr:jg19918 [Pararge aegeria aegeria]
MDVGVPGCWNGSSELVSAALVDPQRGGQTTLSASQVAAGSKRHRTVEFGTPYKRPMSNSGLLSVDMMIAKAKMFYSHDYAINFAIFVFVCERGRGGSPGRLSWRRGALSARAASQRQK